MGEPDDQMMLVGTRSLNQSELGDRCVELGHVIVQQGTHLFGVFGILRDLIETL